jgi:hypothetical protein
MDLNYAAGFGPFASSDPYQTTAQFNAEAADYAAMGIDPAAEIAAMMTPDADADDEPAPADYRQEVITKARAIAAAKTATDVRAAIITAYPGHAPGLAVLDEDMTWVYASGVMAEVIRELAHLAEDEISRNA